MPRYVQLRKVSGDLYKAEAIFSSARSSGTIHTQDEAVINLEAPKHLTNEEILQTAFRNGKWITSRVFPEAIKPKPEPEAVSDEPSQVAPTPNVEPSWANLPPRGRLKAWIASCSNPVLSILIPSQDRLDLLAACLLSLEKTTRGYSVEVIIGDSGSSQQTFDFYRDIGLRVVRFDQPFNFSVVCNGLASAARGEWILFLNNDTEALTEGWPGSLIGREGEVIGCVLVHSNSLDVVHHAGLDIGPHPDSNYFLPFYSGHIGYRRPIEALEHLDTEAAIAQTGAFLFMSKKVFVRLGGFDVAYRLDLQDADFGIRAREAGLRVSCAKSIIFSHVSSGSRTDEQKVFPVNQWKFFSGRRGRSIREWAENRKVSPRTEAGRILIIDDHVPDPEQGFHVPRARSILDFMVELDYRVTVFQTYNQNVSPRSLDRLLFNGIEVVTGEPELAPFLKERSGFYDTIFISRPHNLSRFLKLARLRFPRAQIIYDAEALFYVREKLKAKLFGLGLVQPKESERSELDNLCLADKIIAVSEAEQRTITQERPHASGKIRVWGHSLPANPTPGKFANRRGILFTGNLNAENPNEDSIMFFAKEVWPKVRVSLGCTLAITGSNPTKRVSDLASDSIIVTGGLSSGDLLRYYDGYRVFVVPTRFAAGIPWKLHEAMSHGIPAVVTELIANQLGLSDGSNALVARNPDEFAEKVVRLYSDETLWSRIREGGLSLIRHSCNPDVLRGSLKKILSRQG